MVTIPVGISTWIFSIPSMTLRLLEMLATQPPHFTFSTLISNVSNFLIQFAADPGKV